MTGTPPAAEPRIDIKPEDYIPGPWRELYAALLAAERADAEHHREQIAALGTSDRRAVIAAEWTRSDALGRVAEVRDEIASDLILAVRLAVELRPTGLDDLIRQVPAVRRLRRRVRRLERVLLAVAARSGVRL